MRAELEDKLEAADSVYDALVELHEIVSTGIDKV